MIFHGFLLVLMFVPITLYIVILDGKKEIKSRSKKEKRIIVLSESALLIFEPETSSTTPEQYAVLVFWSDLFSLKEIRRVSSEPKGITFCWEEPETKKSYIEKLIINNSDKFIKALIKNMDSLGALIKTNKFDHTTKAILNKEEVNTMLGVIIELEAVYAENPAKETMRELKEMCKKVAEYYSLRGDRQAEEWRQKIKLLNENNTQIEHLDE